MEKCVPVCMCLVKCKTCEEWLSVMNLNSTSQLVANELVLANVRARNNIIPTVIVHRVLQLKKNLYSGCSTLFCMWIYFKYVYFSFRNMIII